MHRYASMYCRAALLLAVVSSAIIAAPARSEGWDGWPTPPDKHLPVIRQLPDQRHLAIVVRLGVLTPGASREIDVFDLTTDSEFRWDVLNQTMRDLPPRRPGSFAARAANAGRLFYASSHSAHFVYRNGATEVLHLQMPPNMWAPLDGMSSYAISPDGSKVAYVLYGRDKSDKLYTDLMVQDTSGSTPVSVWNDGATVLEPAWRPDARAIAHTDRNNDLVVSDMHGRVLWSIHPADILRHSASRSVLAKTVSQFVRHIQWDPTGRRVAFLMGAPEVRLYVVNSDGTGLHSIAFRNVFGLTKHPEIDTFAWSPDARQLLISAVSTSICNYTALGYKFETGEFPCIYGRDLYLSDSDGGHFRKVSPAPSFEVGDLLWIQ